MPVHRAGRRLRPGEPNELVVAGRQPQGPRAARGLVELGRHHAAGDARAAGAGRCCSDVGADAASWTATDQGRCRDARVLVDGWLVNRTDGARRGRGSTSTCARRGRRARTQARIAGPLLAPGERASACAPRSTSRARPELWSPGVPSRYTATLTTTVGDAIAQVDRERDRPARRSSVRDGHLRLNGQRIELRGASIQEDIPGRGPGAERRRHRADRRATCRPSTPT